MFSPRSLVRVVVTVVVLCAYFEFLSCNGADALPTPEPATSFLLTPETVPLLESDDDDDLDERIAPLQNTTPSSAMVPVSSTVIPVANAKAPAARQAPVIRYQSRRFSFFDKSSKPDAPIRLITKNTNLKKFYETPAA